MFSLRERKVNPTHVHVPFSCPIHLRHLHDATLCTKNCAAWVECRDYPTKGAQTAHTRFGYVLSVFLFSSSVLCLSVFQTFFGQQHSFLPHVQSSTVFVALFFSSLLVHLNLGILLSNLSSINVIDSLVPSFHFTVLLVLFSAQIFKIPSSFIFSFISHFLYLGALASSSFISAFYSRTWSAISLKP